jgi:hypothetical protein
MAGQDQQVPSLQYPEVISLPEENGGKNVATPQPDPAQADVYKIR